LSIFVSRNYKSVIYIAKRLIIRDLRHRDLYEFDPESQTVEMTSLGTAFAGRLARNLFPEDDDDLWSAGGLGAHVGLALTMFIAYIPGVHYVVATSSTTGKRDAILIDRNTGTLSLLSLVLVSSYISCYTTSKD
jgi:hypothetical protein